jgi:stage V sporulation protein S
MSDQYNRTSSYTTRPTDLSDPDVYAENEVFSGADVIKVSAKSRSTAVAGAIAAVIREHRHAEVQAIGAGAVNQAVKALAIARGYLTRDEIDIVFTPYFTEVDIDGQERTAVRFTVEPRP